VFERFTERARLVVVLAQDEARALKHDYIGTEHLLLGLLREEEGVAAHVLGSLGVTADEIRTLIVQVIGEGEGVGAGQIPFTPRAKKVLELSLREALSLNHNNIGTEHILLGLTGENEGVAKRVLLDLGVELQRIREVLVEVLGLEIPAERWVKGRRRWRPPRPVAMVAGQAACWQYRIERRERVEADFLNQLGDEGWELVSVHPVADWVELIFKRRRMPGALRAAG
jgi:ATP-dependent Clp protease ATP-binding subunit ClpA